MSAIASEICELVTRYQHLFDYTHQQEARLSQRDRAMLCVIEYVAKSLKVIWNDTLEIRRKSLLVFPCNYGLYLALLLGYSALNNGVTLKFGFGVVTRSLKIALLDRPYTTLYRLAIVSIALSCTISELLGIEFGIMTLKSRFGVTQIAPFSIRSLAMLS